MPKDIIYPKVVVLCSNSEGSPEFHTCTPCVTHIQMIAGEHYALAEANAEDNGFSGPMMSFDATDRASRQLAEIAEWINPKTNKQEESLASLASEVIKQCGNNSWGECEQFPKVDWALEVANNETVIGYWEWVVCQATASEVPISSLSEIRRGPARQKP